MLVSYTIRGIDYSQNKTDFKKLLAKHGLKWKGHMHHAIWGSNRETITGVFIRDEDRNITLTATLTWEGEEDTEFLTEFKKWVTALIPKTDHSEILGIKQDDINRRIQQELELWDITHKPDIKHLKTSGRPVEWIKNDIENWKRERGKIEQRLLSIYGIEKIGN